MFSKKTKSAETTTKKTTIASSPSIISSDVTIVGNVISQGLMQLDGKIEGEIDIRHLTIGTQGWVEGSIIADDVTIKGQVTGSIKAKKVLLEKSAQVHGDIQHEIISIEAGAIIEGRINQTSEKVSENVTELTNSKANKQNVANN